MCRHVYRLSLIVAASLAATGCASAQDQPAAPPPTAQAADTMDALPHDLTGEIRRAQLLRVKGDYNNAIRSLAQLMLVAPDDPRVVGEYGKALVQAGRSAEAVDFLKRAIELQPDNWSLYSALGVAQDQLGQTALATENYRHALELKPDEPSTLNNLAMSLMMAGNLAEAETLLREAQAHGGDSPRIAQNLKQIAEMRAQSAAPQGQPESQAPVARPAALASLPHPTPVRRRPLGAPRPLLAHTTTSPRVIMAKIPYDPLAGKHYGPSPKPARQDAKPAKDEAHLAAAETKKPAELVPPLRTAADIY